MYETLTLLGAFTLLYSIVATRVEHVLTTLSSIKIQQRLHFYLAKDLTQGAHARELDEEIETVRMPLGEAVRLATTGAVVHTPSITAILLAAQRVGA